jgi:uncharacterized membrane protein YjfL (UPF0719 family)
MEKDINMYRVFYKFIAASVILMIFALLIFLVEHDRVFCLKENYKSVTIIFSGDVMGYLDPCG